MSKFQYPVGSGTREDFEKNWYVALDFGSAQSYGFHEGIDLNLRTGGDTDHGQPLRAIADWILKYYHLKSHLESGFGEHLVYEVESPWGKRWIHYAHCQKSVNPEIMSFGKKGDKLAEIDKTGRPRLILPAHLHMSVFKVDPAEVKGGIDSIAKTKKELDASWEDPIDFMHKWNDYKEEEMDLKQLIIDLRVGLLDKAPSEDEIAWDLAHWEGSKAFIQRITGDGRFSEKYVAPLLEAQKKASEDGCNRALSEKDDVWQKAIETAKKEAKLEYEVLLHNKIENTSMKTLLAALILKVLPKKPPKKQV